MTAAPQRATGANALPVAPATPDLSLIQAARDHIRGFADAVCALVRDHGNETHAWGLLGDSGWSLDVFTSCGIDDNNLIIIRDLFEQFQPEAA